MIKIHCKVFVFSALIEGTISAIKGNGFNAGFLDGLASGLMWGGIFAGAAQTIAGSMKITRALKPNFDGFKIGKLKIWSPNITTNENIGGTILKIGKFNRIDSEITRMLHLHIRIFGYKINHIPIGTILSSLFGGLYNVKN